MIHIWLYVQTSVKKIVNFTIDIRKSIHIDNQNQILDLKLPQLNLVDWPKYQIDFSGRPVYDSNENEIWKAQKLFKRILAQVFRPGKKWSPSSDSQKENW